ncbi:chemotaxis protein CheD [uncultured Sunxiuqinia sp.]|uniref:chemotaxis protein CheD n=1 Tax=uncultured Sunxiuqinia sp. TaxID=1573825 RepID=UPI002AA91C07|nr:chemotaxis protein CheD [uncultured Sunxiuqinia sp.]
MENVIFVSTGEVKVCDINNHLKSTAIGSCVVVTAWDSFQKIGGMAHVMLPGAAPKGKKEYATKYASNAIDKLLGQLSQLGTKKENLKVYLIGGADVLKRENDTIGEDNLRSIQKCLGLKGLLIDAMAVGDTSRRSAFLNVSSGFVYYTEGDSDERLLSSTTELSI